MPRTTLLRVQRMLAAVAGELEVLVAELTAMRSTSRRLERKPPTLWRSTEAMPGSACSRPPARTSTEVVELGLDPARSSGGRKVEVEVLVCVP